MNRARLVLGVVLFAIAGVATGLPINAQTPMKPAPVLQQSALGNLAQNPDAVLKCEGVPFNQINALRTEPERAGELLEKFVAEAFPGEKERQDLFNEKYGDKTIRERLDATIKFIESQGVVA